ncbi:hypothetical protein [Pontibacter akesuensis]|uniref:Outer membrane protein assembly factor BamB, contains PQQ-like beta-propeller repeat n=1 Tax=Pontibacter akesuensis TaxID=388950 RepID=A0A1I7J7J6_9BACT|nr:hypothetical protein [Pontibacter akesuensis]GHA71926.1 hypothetical protein GCM10007389_26990 [Pontibacter akesuensis]SFU81148.1 hypothetical protein SAMN04487941_2565 [Pontibacter akesuensis]
MPKRIVFIFIGLVILASLVFYGFSRWQGSREIVDLWALVPEDAAVVVETNNHQALVDHLEETELWQSFSVLPFIQTLEEDIMYLDSVAPGSQRLERFLDKKDILTSVHIAGKTDVAFVFYVPVSTVGEHRFLRSLTEDIDKSPIFTQDTREYQGHLLTDIANTRTGRSFTYFTYHNNIILSASPVLVEEIVRRITRGNPTSIAAEFKNTNYLAQPEVYANVFVNYRVLPDLLGLFLSDEVMPTVRYLATLCQNAMLELKLEKGEIFLNGFSTPEKLKNSLHQVMQPQAPQPLGVKAYLPNRTALLLHFGLEEIERLRLPLQHNKSTYATTVDSLAQTLSQEAALAYLESGSINQSPEKVAYVHLGQPMLAQRLLTQLNKQVSAARQQKPLTEKYGSYTLQLLNVPELPAQLLGRVFSGFEQSYVVQVGDYLLIAEEMATLRHLLDDISEEKVWGKSVGQTAFIAKTLQEANMSVYLNTVNAWYVLNRYITEEDRDNLLRHAPLIKRFSQVSLQFSIVEGEYYTSMVVRKPEQINNAGQNTLVTEEIIRFNSRLVTRPFPLQNAVDRSREVVVQDSSFVLHNITAGGKRGWTDTLGASLQTDVKQIEYGADKKLRYLFATSSQIHAINNQGQPLDNFPFNLPDSLTVQHLAVFDYEKNGNHRLLVDDNMGNLYMYDMQGTAIQGWQPRRLDYRLAAEPQHLRVGGNDVILALLENGYIYALNRSGETLPGFPISLGAPLTSGAVAKVGADLKRTEITAVTRYGNVVTFNLQGRVLNTEQLLRPSKRALFELVPEASNGRSFVIARQEQGKLALFDQDLNELFEKRYVTSASKIVQYFNFGGDNRIVAITERGPQKTYLYDMKGNLIGNRTLENYQPVTIYFNETSNSYTLYRVHRNELMKLEFTVGE